MAGLENYTFLTSETSMNEPNSYAGRTEQVGEGISNNTLEDQKPAEFEDDFLDRPISTRLVTETLSWLGVQILGEQEWEYGLCSVLEEMKQEGLLILWDRRLQIEIRPHDCRLVWAYLPMHQHTWLAEFVDLKPSTQVLLSISASRVEDRPTALYEKLLRHQIGHVLRYLQNPTRPNECYHASREWTKWSK
jgi:hypothetical protein